MMQLSRKQRREAACKSFRRKFLLYLAGMIWLLFLYWAWYFPGPLVFTLTGMITFFQLLMLNIYKIRSYLPGLSASSRWLKMSTIVVYILAFILLMSELSSLER